MLRSIKYKNAWASTPWGRTLPRSCVGTDPDRYRLNLKLIPQLETQELENLFFKPVVALLSNLFSIPFLPLELSDATPVPGWALREMNPGMGIPMHCEQDWNPVNLIENGRILKADFEPRMQMSYLYCVDSPSEGGELFIPSNQRRVTMKPGQLLLFNAGYHPHQVCTTKGSQKRVVLGGFVRLNKNHTHFHCYV